MYVHDVCGVCLCHGMHVKGRGQLWVVRFHLCVGSGIKLRLLGLCGKTFTH